MTCSTDDSRTESSIELSDQALDWIVKLHSGAAQSEDRIAWRKWRQTSPDHEAAAQEAELIWQGIGTAGVTWSKKARSRRVTRRTVLAGGSAIAFAAGLNQAGILGPHLLAEYQTATAERRSISLKDGTRVTMNARTALSGRFSEGRRRADMYRGQAIFTVADTGAVPFTITDRRTRLHCSGGTVDVNLCEGMMSVVVLDGVATLSGAEGDLRLSRNQRVTVSDDGRFSRVAAVDAEAETAWRRGKLIFDRRRLGDLAVELERYRGGRILILGDQLAGMEVSGVFDLGAPDAVLETIQMSLPVRVSRLPMVAIIRDA